MNNIRPSTEGGLVARYIGRSKHWPYHAPKYWVQDTANTKDISVEQKKDLSAIAETLSEKFSIGEDTSWVMNALEQGYKQKSFRLTTLNETLIKQGYELTCVAKLYKRAVYQFRNSKTKEKVGEAMTIRNLSDLSIQEWNDKLLKLVKEVK